MRRVFIASVIGTVIEWFDFFLYTAAATLVLSAAFFPTDDPAVGTLIAFSTVAVGFLARPIGGLIFGQIGDRLGRKRALVLTLWLMGSATVVTGLLPTYAQIGVWAPVILVVVRIVQGIGVGGEYGGAVLMILEHNRRPDRLGFLGSVPNACASAGFLLASATLAVIAALTSAEQFQSWGWRIPFVASAGLLVVGYYIRRSVGESPVFDATRSVERTRRFPVLEVVRAEPLPLFVAFAVPAAVAVAYNLVLVYLTSYSVGTGVSPGTMLTITALAQACYIPMILAWGALSDVWGRRGPMAVGTLGLALWVFVAFPLAGSRTPVLIFIGLVVSLFFTAAMYGPQAAFLASLFRPEYRYSGISLGYQLAFAVAGGTTPIVSVALYDRFESWLPIAALPIAAAVLSLAALNSSRRIDLSANEMTGSAEASALAGPSTDRPRA